MAKRISFFSVKLVKEKSSLYDLQTKIIRSPEDGHKALREIVRLEEYPKEIFGILSLSTKNEIIGVHIVHMGSLNASIVHPREVFQHAVLTNAASVLAFHNHPSGDPTPSREDIEVTKRLAEAGKILGIELLDHVIEGHDGRYVSLKEKGYV